MKPTIDISDSIELSMGIDRAWELVTDPQVVVACVPGAEVVEIDEDGNLYFQNDKMRVVDEKGTPFLHGRGGTFGGPPGVEP